MAHSIYSYRRLARFIAVVATLFAIAQLCMPGRASAQTVWSGLTFTFSKEDITDPELAANQDRLTDEVWLSRGQFGAGLLNVAPTSADCGFAGCSYTHNFSPDGTEWATSLVTGNTGKTIAATNHANLAFSNWEDAYGGRFHVGSAIVNRDAVVHLITDNIYLDLRFTDWSTGGGGGFSYQRAVAPTVPQATGDYNQNGVVDAADYVVWRKTLNQSASPAGSGADGSANGTVDPPDYDFWRARFGNVVPGAGANVGAVPEPASISAAAVLAALLLGTFRSRRCS